MSKMGRRLSEKLSDGASIFATVVGTFKVIGLLSGVWIFTQIGQTFAISPSPSPYSSVNTTLAEDLGSGQIFGCEDKNGDVTWAKWNYLVRGAVPGPHRRGVTFLSYFKLAGRPDKSPKDRTRFELLTRYYFCQDATLTRAARCAPNPEAIHFKNINAATGEVLANLRVPCTL